MCLPVIMQGYWKKAHLRVQAFGQFYQRFINSVIGIIITGLESQQQTAKIITLSLTYSILGVYYIRFFPLSGLSLLQRIKPLPFVTEALTLGKSIGIFIGHTEYQSQFCLSALFCFLLLQHTPKLHAWPSQPTYRSTQLYLLPGFNLIYHYCDHIFQSLFSLFGPWLLMMNCSFVLALYKKKNAKLQM